MIAVAGLDMAAWDALAKAAGMPLCVSLGGSVGAVNAYNSNGLWLREPEEVAAEAIELRDEGGFTGLKLRLGRDNMRDDRLDPQQFCTGLIKVVQGRIQQAGRGEQSAVISGMATNRHN